MKPLYQRSKGFTLIEVILTLGISSIVLISIFSLLDFSKNAYIKGEAMDSLLLNGRYAIEYIKNDIKDADMIISSDKFSGLRTKYPSNIGFVILKVKGEDKSREYNFITYHINNDKFVRISSNRSDGRYPGHSYFSGHNNLAEYVKSINKTQLDPISKIVYLEFEFTHESGEKVGLRSDVHIRSPIDY